MMQLGFVSAILAEDDLETVLGTAVETGFDTVEIMCWPPGKAERRYAGITHIDVTDFSESEAKDVHSLCDKYGVSISGLGYYPNPLSPDKEEADVAVEQIRRLIEAAAVLGINQANSFVGRDWSKTVDDNWQRFIDTWGPLVDHAEKYNVKIGIENCPMFFSNDEWPGGKNLATSPAIWKRMFTDLPSPHFGLNYDPSHMIWQQMDYLSPMRDFADRIFHVHAKDVRIDTHRLNEVGILANPAEYHTPKLPGLGDIDWGQFISVLGDTGYDGAVCVEVEDRIYEKDAETRKMSLHQSSTYLRNFIPFQE